ncbi:unnamed protein product [Caenorhabditis bovis]|uniref:Receptor-mediated endocytosis protein 6 n=1 Tax=Caenorhabditis bovis TaxID=2654633 RepID=A0A8S1EPD8_9PELO|nr:unnamed protein product [Caenorhabditis bovis]
MADLLQKIRNSDSYKELYEIATRIRNQKLLTDSEQESLDIQRQNVAVDETRVLTEAWRCFYYKNILQQLKSQSDPLDPQNVCRLIKIISETESVPAYKAFGHHYSSIEDVLTTLYHEPNTVAKLMQNFDENDIHNNDSISNIFYQMVYSCGLFPEDELRLSQAVCQLLKLQLSSARGRMRQVIRKETAICTRFYRLYVETSHPTMVYLTGALRSSIIKVIQTGNFWLDIDEKQSANRFLRDNFRNKERLPEYRALVVSRLVELVDSFLEEIHKSLAILPPSLNWIIRNIFESLRADNDNAELTHACKDMFISNLICSAIISPQKFGIIDNDVRIGAIVSHNLAQIAMLIKAIPLQNLEEPPSEYKEFLTECRKTNLVSEMMETMLMDIPAPEVEVISVITNERLLSDKMKKTMFVGSIGEMNEMIKLARIESNMSDPSLWHIRKKFSKLPESFACTTQHLSMGSPEHPSRLSTLKNFQKKMLSGIKRNDPHDIEERRTIEKLDSINIVREEFEIFLAEYHPELYKELPSEEPIQDKHEPTPVPDDAPVRAAEEIAPQDEIVKTDDVSFSANEIQQPTEIDTISVKDKMENRSTSVSADHSTQEDGQTEVRGFAKLKIIGDRMKKGLTQSNTLTDIRSHIRRSASMARPETTLSSSASEQTLTSASPRDDILEKYASKAAPTVKPEHHSGNLISFESPRIEDIEPYYSSENLLNCRAFKDTLRKLGTVLGSISYLPHINCRVHGSDDERIDQKYLLYRFLSGLLCEAEHRRENGLAAQLLEVKRCIDLFLNDEVKILLEHLKLDEISKEEKFAELREQRILLMRQANDISSLEQKVILNKKLIEQNLVDSLMRIFLDSGFVQNKAPNTRSAEVETVLKFYDDFKHCHVQDERAELLKQLLEHLQSRLLKNADWSYASEPMIERAMIAIERYVMFGIYETAFYPNLGADQPRDKVLQASIATLALSVTPNSDFLRIPRRLHGEAPWPSAQAELSMLDIYVTARDKLKCIVRCCDVINNLIALSSKNAVASADDITPVLVFVIIKANPRALLSNVQFVEAFAGECIESGRDAYYWTNFKSAVEYIKTIL